MCPYLLAMGTQSIVDPEDGFSLFTTIHIFIIKNLARGARKEIMGIKRVFLEELERGKGAKQEEKLEWTLYGLNLLKENTSLPNGGARAGYVVKDR